ncbi:MAG: molybdopterin molybdotransferase MoeA [Actinobacteria bacterium]|nr:molybdopterin molybdotransferase MoeA [Actinomycetota bacterium]
MPALLTIDEALALVLRYALPLEAEAVPIEQAAGRVPAEDVRALVSLPPFRSSAMDGFAVRVRETPGRLRVVDRIPAGRPAQRALAAGEAMGIATGGSVPDGADGVVPIEHVEDGGAEVVVSASVSEEDNIRGIGSDIGAGELLLSAGSILGAAQIGALAAAGVAAVRCSRRPRVAVLSTGTELRPAGSALEPGQIYESNAPMLAAALAGSGAAVTRLPAVTDDPDSHRAALERGLEADVLVSSGGVSVGPHDLVRRIAAELGVEEIFWGVAVKPGKPVAFGVRGRTLVFGLPGNPVSALVGAELFVRPALRALQGASIPEPAYAVGRLSTPLRASPARDQLIRARSRLEGGEVVLEPLSGQESHMIARAAGADTLVLVARGDREHVAGDLVPFLRL